MQIDLCFYVDVLVQERHNSSALAMELRLSCTNQSMYSQKIHHKKAYNFLNWKWLKHNF